MNIKLALLSFFFAAPSCNTVPADSSAGMSSASSNAVRSSETASGEAGAGEAGTGDSASPVLEPDFQETTKVIRSDFWIAKDARQGAVINARAPSNAARVALNGMRLPISKDGFFLIGFDRDSGSAATLVATLTDGSKVQKTLPVAAGKWRLERINAPYRGGRSSATFRKLRGPEIAQIVAARKIATDAQGWRQDFIWPVKGRISGRFGSQRIYQGKPGSYHSGLDIAAPTGTPYVAPADGVVILATQKPFTLEGNLLMIDHGNGLNSAFLHSSSIAVKKGDTVKQGQVIGKIGATGRATGPHLHWGMKWHKARTDPLLLLPPQ